VVLGEVVSEIVLTFGPVDEELALMNAIADPVELHVHCLGATLFDGVIGDSGGCTVVGLHWCRALLETEFFQSSANRYGFLAVVEEAGGFRFGGAGDD